MDKKKFMALAALALTITGAVLYSYRMDIAMNLRQRELARQIGPNVPVNWQSGPAQAAQTAAERPPNIVFILADDLGINDISTFGGGVADGAVPTPNIDRLAKQGLVFKLINNRLKRRDNSRPRPIFKRKSAKNDKTIIVF